MSSDETPTKETESQDQTLAVDSPSASESSQCESPPSESVDAPEAAVVGAPDSDEAGSNETGSNETDSNETGQAESSPPTDQSAATSVPESSSEEIAAEKLERKVRLNPTIDATQAMAVPSLGATPTVAISNSSPAPTTTAAGGDASADDTGSSAATLSDQSFQPPLKPIDIPPDDANLGAQMEAEIEAALTSGELDGATVNVSSDTSEEDALPLSEENLEKGQKLTGKIQSIHGDDVFLDLGLRSPGVVPKRQFVSGKKPEIGLLIEVSVDRVNAEEGLVLVNLPKGLRKVSSNWESIEVGQIVDCMVTKSNKGGLEVTVSSLRGFMPAGQVDLGFVSDLEPYIGQKLRVKIIDANAKKRNLVVSRRAYLQIERKEAEETLWKTLAEGQTFEGTIKTLKDYGAFVDIGGIDGFLHIGEISWTRLKHPSDELEVGQQVDVKVLKLDPENKKISLGMKQLVQNPWTSAADKYASGTTVSGKVTRVADFGAFVELEPGLEGLIHISELDYKRVNRVADVLNVGQEVDIKVLEVDSKRRRIGLSLKALLEKPQELKDDVDLAPGGDAAPIQRKRKGPLKGGTGLGSGSGMFGNPGDFS